MSSPSLACPNAWLAGCLALGSAAAKRSTQRKVPTTPGDQAARSADTIELARRCGRYGYRRVTALLRAAGGRVNRKRVEPIWRRASAVC